jgi:hypothetical protein
MPKGNCLQRVIKSNEKKASFSLALAGISFITMIVVTIVFAVMISILKSELDARGVMLERAINGTYNPVVNSNNVKSSSSTPSPISIGAPTSGQVQAAQVLEVIPLQKFPPSRLLVTSNGNLTLGPSKPLAVVGGVYTFIDGSVAEDCFGYLSAFFLAPDGVYKMQYKGRIYHAFCSMSEGGYIVVQKRFDGSQSFFQGWSRYKEGFGNLFAEYWLGLDTLWWLTEGNPRRIKIVAAESPYKFSAEWGIFSVGSEAQKYMLTAKSFDRAASTYDFDFLQQSDGKYFSTWEVDNDAYSAGSCATYYGAFWHGACSHIIANLDYGKSIGHNVMKIFPYHWDGYRGLTSMIIMIS